MLTIGFSTRSADFARIAFAYSVPAIAYLWTMYLVLSRRKWNKLLKFAGAVLVSSLFYFFSDTVVVLLLGRGIWFPKFDFTSMDMASIEQSTSWAVLILGVIISAITGFAGLRRQKKDNDKKDQ
jgi:hypothetical protein